MTNLLDKCKNQSKRKHTDDEDIFDSSIFDILENDFQVGDIVWAKLNGFPWWPAFVFGCFSDNWKHVKVISKPGFSSKKQYFIYCFGSQFKYGWVSQTSLCQYKDLEECSENQVEQITTKRTNEKIRNQFKLSISDELHPLWKEALKQADEIFDLPMNLRINSLEKILRQLLIKNKYKISQQEQTIISDQIPTITNKCSQITSELVEKTERRFSLNSTIKATDQLTKNSDNDIVIVKINSPIQSSTVSLTTAICHFLDKGIPSLTIYEEIRLVNELLNHSSGILLSLIDAQSYYQQYVINIALINYKHHMLFVQYDYFYDFLLKYPQIILKYRHWFKDFKQTLMPINSDKIHLKKWQLATLLHAHINLEQHFP